MTSGKLNVVEYVSSLTAAARRAALAMLSVSAADKNAALEAVADAIEKSAGLLKRANAKDLDAASASGVAAPLVERLKLTDKSVAAMVQGVRDIARLDDPVNRIDREWTTDAGLRIRKIRQPIGVIVVIYESRPNVTVDSAALCLKTSNAVILRGGSESIHSNLALAQIIGEALAGTAVDPSCVQVVSITDRAVVGELLKRTGEVDVVIPRGGKELIHRVVTESHIPVVKHYEGICHVYVDDECDAELAKRVVVNAKVQRAAVCNAMETLILNKSLPDKALRPIIDGLKSAGVALIGDDEARRRFPGISPATEESWRTEYLDLILNVRMVDNVDNAIAHINRYGSKHTDAIITTNAARARRFCEKVDSAAVMVNCSTRLHDGAQFGMGAEIGISTDKLHARGPMGLEELTIYKYVVEGAGQIRE